MAWLGVRLGCPSKNMTWELYSEYAQYMGITLICFSRVTQSILAIAPRPENPTGTPRWNNRMMNMTLEVGVTYMISKLDT